MPETQTFTYDPTEDALIDEANEARDAENLEVGEKMIEEQEKLLAGKYKTTEDLEKAYNELEKKLGEQDKGLEREPNQSEAEKSEDSKPEYQFYTEDGAVNYETANELYGEQLGKTFKDSNIDPFKMNEYFVENNGTLSDEMYDQLGKAGLSKDLVNAYLKGVRAETDIQAAPEVSTLSESDINSVKSIAGGDDGYEALMSWATDNLSDEDAKNFDEVVETGNKAAVTFAVKALMGQYEDANGRDAKLVTGKASRTQTYRSMAEVVRDMNNPLYESDESYRDDVRRKLELSQLKV